MLLYKQTLKKCGSGFTKKTKTKVLKLYSFNKKKILVEIKKLKILYIYIDLANKMLYMQQVDYGKNDVEIHGLYDQLDTV